MMNQWCDCQMKCKEDTENTFTCCAHLEEGMAFQCPRKPTEVIITKDGMYKLDRCPDFEPPKGDFSRERKPEVKNKIKSAILKAIERFL
jgi:hypothetical protein